MAEIDTGEREGERDEAIDILARFAEGRTTHAYTGACPSDESPSSRDPECMVCWAIDAALASAAQPSDAAWDKVLRERDDADDFIDALLDEVLGADRPEWSNLYDRADALDDVRERMAVLEKPASAQFRRASPAAAIGEANAWDGEEAPDGGCVAKQRSDTIREGQEKG